MREIWKTIPQYPYHEASNMGNIRSISRPVKHSRTGNLFLKKGKVLAKRKNNCGYLRVGLASDGLVKWELVHRLVANAWIPNPKNKRTINHKDADKTNNCKANLEWNTHKENIKHAKDNGLRNPAKGIQFKTRVKFDESSIRIIRECFSAGYKHENIAHYFNVSRPTITRVINRVIWSHVL